MSADFADLYGGVKDALTDILGGMSRRRQQPAQPAYDAYMQSLYQGPAGGAVAPAPLGGSYDPAATQALYSGPGGAQAGAQQFGSQRALFAGPGETDDRNVGGFLASANLGAYAAKQQAKAEKDAAALSGKGRESVEGGDWSGPATADDNATLSPEKVDAWIAQTRPNSPLKGMGGYLLGRANELGVSLPLFLGILLKESELGTTAGPGYNLAGVGGAGNFRQYGSWQQAADDALRNLAGSTYKGKSAAEQVTTWYAGPQAWQQYGTRATDAGGGGAPSPNGSAQQYLDGPVSAAYGGLGVPLNATAAGTRKAGGGATVSPDGAYFPVVGWTQPVQLHWGSAEGTGGTDIMAPAGSQIVAVRGGRVTYAAYDPTGGWAVMIQGDDGLQYYMAHMQSAPSVRVGQRIGAGTPLGLVGNTGNASTGPAHLHIGIGPQIRTGTGALGGTGEYPDGRPFDAVSYLNRILGSRTSGRGGGTSPKRA